MNAPYSLSLLKIISPKAKKMRSAQVRDSVDRGKEEEKTEGSRESSFY